MAPDDQLLSYEPPAAIAPTTSRGGRHRFLALGPGLALVTAVASVATYLGSLLPVVGSPVFGIVIGAGLAAIIRPGTVIDRGVRFAGRSVLQGSIVLLGTGLSLAQVLRVGASSLPVMLGSLAAALGGAWIFGRLLQVDGDIRTLIGVGTGICGASAIATVTAVIGAGDADVAYAIGTIFTFNIAAVLLFPSLGHLLGLSQHAFGLWSGTAINDMSSVVAAAYTFGPVAGAYAVVVKLTRTLMIIPIAVTLASLHAQRQARQTGAPRQALDWRRIFPLFILGFLGASALDSIRLIPPGWHAPLTWCGIFMITMALTGIGLSTRLSALRSAGHRPLLLGAILWATVATTSLLLQSVTGTY